MRNYQATALSLSFLLALGAGACTSDGAADDAGDDVTPSSAKLTIVGEHTVLLENTWTADVTVRYSDEADEPLAGMIDFTLTGEVSGAFLSGTSIQTNANGEATITLTAGSAGNANFTIDASAAEASDVSWDVQVLERALEVTGSYRLDSNFDMASGLPGTAGQVVNTFIDMTDGPYDPATWVLDQLVNNISNSTIRDFVNATRPILDGILYDLLVENTPDIVQQIIDVGDAFGQVAKKFGTISTLVVTDSNDVDGGLSAAHHLTDLVFTIDGETSQYPLADLGMAHLDATPSFSYDATKFTVGAHEFPLSYGSILMVALEEIILPMIDPNATDLESFLVNLVPCADVGVAISDYVGFGSASLYEGACLLGIGAGANYIEGRIRSLDTTAMNLGIAGTARWIDSNHDHKVDVLQGGQWTGNMVYGSAPAPLGPSPFHGERLALN